MPIPSFQFKDGDNSNGFFKGRMWNKVKAFDFMLCTTGNEKSVTALEEAMELNEFARYLGICKRHVQLRCDKIDTIMDSRSEVTWNAESYDEWGAIRNMGCKLNKSNLTRKPPDSPAPPDPAPLNLPASPALSSIRENLTDLSQQLSEHDACDATQHIPQSFLERLAKLHAFDEYAENGVSSEHNVLPALKADLRVLFERLEAHRTDFDVTALLEKHADDIPDVPDKDLPHVDGLWSHQHRINLHAAIKQVTEQDATGESCPAIATEICSVSQTIVQKTVGELQTITDNAGRLREIKIQDEKDMTSSLASFDLACDVRQGNIRQCVLDMETVRQTIKEQEEKYEAHLLEYEQRTCKFEQLASNTSKVRDTFDRLVSLLDERFVLLKKKIEDQHRQARRAGEVHKFKFHSEIHLKRLQDHLERNEEEVRLLTAQRNACSQLRTLHRDLACHKEKSIYTGLIASHTDHLHCLETLRCSMGRNICIKRRQMKDVTSVMKRLEKELGFCTLVSDSRVAELKDEMRYLDDVRQSALKLVAKMTTRFADLDQQAAWSTAALQSCGVAAPTPTCLGHPFHSHSDTTNPAEEEELIEQNDGQSSDSSGLD